MAEDFRDWDNARKYIKSPYHGNTAKVGHIEYLNKSINVGALGEKAVYTEATGTILIPYLKNSFIYKGDSEGSYQLPDPTLNHGREIFIINKSLFDLNVLGGVWDFLSISDLTVISGATAYLFSDGENWATY